MPQDILTNLGGFFTYTPQEMVINLILATILGVIVALIYRHTHKGLSYSQSFTQTVVFVAVIVAIVMMVIGSSLARAFALVGALSIIRFRTVVKDTRDTAFVFAGLAVGMASGTSNYFLAVLGTAFVIVISLILYHTNFGALYKSEFILRFTFDQEGPSSEYLARIQEFAKRSNLLHIEPSGDKKTLRLTYDITLQRDATAEGLTAAMAETQGVSQIVLVASKNDVDY